jgi:hypothetical protein
MSFDFDRFRAIRPFAYHLTARSNLPVIEKLGRLLCSATLLEMSHCEHLAKTRRIRHETIHIPDGAVAIRDQKPLAFGAIQFDPDWNERRFISHVNDHVFLWPGTESGPISHGQNHFARYETEMPIILRFPMSHVKALSPTFSRYNSGAPRCSSGKRSPRGSGRFSAS